MVFCIFKDALAVDAAHHDMINSCAQLDTAFPWYDTILFGTLTCPLCPLLVEILAGNQIIPLYKSCGYLQVFMIDLLDFH